MNGWTRWPVPLAAGRMMHDTLHDTIALLSFAPPPPPLSCPVAPGFAHFELASVLPGPCWVCCEVELGGGRLTLARVPPPGSFPFGGADACTPRQGVTLLYGPSICTRFVQMDLRRNQVRQPFPTPGSGTLWVAGESLRDRRVSCLPRWTVCPTRSPSQDTNRSTCRGECSWSGPLATPPGRCHHGPLANGPGRNPPYCVRSGGADTVTGGAPKPLRSGSSPASLAGSCRPGPPPSAVLVLASPLSSLGFPPSRAPFCSPWFLPCPVRPSCPSPLRFLVSRPGSGCPASPPLAVRLSLRRGGLPCAPPPCPLAVSPPPPPLSCVGGDVGGGAPLYSALRRMHVASTMQARGAALVPLRGGACRVAPFVALCTLCTRPRCPLRRGLAQRELPSGPALWFRALSLLPPHPAAVSAGGTLSVLSLSTSPSLGGGGVGGGGGAPL